MCVDCDVFLPCSPSDLIISRSLGQNTTAPRGRGTRDIGGGRRKEREKENRGENPPPQQQWVWILPSAILIITGAGTPGQKHANNNHHPLPSTQRRGNKLTHRVNSTDSWVVCVIFMQCES